MNNPILANSVRFIVLVLFQVLVLNNILFSGYVNPYLYVIFILLLPFTTPPLLLLIISFALGFSLDLLSHTYGMHAAACVAMAFTRPFVLKNINSRQDYEPGIQPIIKDLGFSWVMTYSAILVFIHHFILFFLEAFTLFNFWTTLLRLLFSTIFTLVMIILTHYLFFKTKK